MYSSVSAGKKELYYKTWETSRSSHSSRTKERGVTATTTEASSFSASLAKSLQRSSCYQTAEAGRTCPSWITVRLPSLKVNNRHGLLPLPTPGEVQRTTDAPVCRFHWPHKRVSSCQQRWSLPDPSKDWLPTRITEHDRFLPHKHERDSAVQRQLLQALSHPQLRQTRVHPSPNTLWNLFCLTLETRLWHSIRGDLSADQGPYAPQGSRKLRKWSRHSKSVLLTF